MMDCFSEYSRITRFFGERLNELENKNILVTGATGLIGSYLTNFLMHLNEGKKFGINVYAMTRSKERAERLFPLQNNLNVIEQDLSEPLKFAHQVDYIIHAASNAHPLAYSMDPVGTMETNLIGTINLLKLATKSNAKFIYFSSGEIYGNRNGYAFSEDDCGLVDPKKVRSCYSESKRAAETLCIAYKHQFKTRINIARLCYVYGPTITEENSRADAQFLRNALNGEDIVLKSRGLQKRTYCYVADIVSAVLYILLNNFEEEVFNIANPKSVVSVREYAESLSKIAGVRLKFELPSVVEKQGYSVQMDSILDASKLIKTGWEPLFSFEEGIRNTFLIKRNTRRY